MREDLSPDNIVMYYRLCGEITLTMGDRSWQIAVCLPNMVKVMFVRLRPMFVIQLSEIQQFLLIDWDYFIS